MSPFVVPFHSTTKVAPHYGQLTWALCVNNMCIHLKPILDYLSNEHDIKVVKTTNGKGWGVGYLVNGEIPYDEIIKNKILCCGVTASQEHGLISCKECWENIAEYNRYHNHWG